MIKKSNTYFKSLRMKKKSSLFKLLLCGFLSLCFVCAGYAQSKTITGKVTGKDNIPLEGATVQAKGSNITTQTKDDGSFSIEVPASVSALIFSFVGHNDKEVAIGSSTVMDVSLVAGSESLQDVVVIGYGTRRKSDLTGAVATVKASQLQERPASSLSQALAGRVTGVQVNSN